MTLKRNTAESYIQAVRDRAAMINDGPYAYKVSRIEVFGSYLTDKAVLGDLDLMIQKSPRYSDPAHQEALCNDRRRAAHQAGRVFRSYLDEAYWPEEEVDRLLRGKNYSVSIHHADERTPLLDAGAVFQVIFEA